MRCFAANRLKFLRTGAFKSRIHQWEEPSANRLFGQSGYEFRQSFLSLLNDSYGAPFEPMDFRKDPALAARQINAWVESQTRRSIRNLIAETALNGPWRGQVEHLVTPPPVQEPAFYHGLLAPQSENIDIWETEYLQVLEGENPVKEWTKGTWLTRYLDALAGPDKLAFEAAYGERVAKAYPRNSGGQTLFPFRRLFMVAQRKG